MSAIVMNGIKRLILTQMPSDQMIMPKNTSRIAVFVVIIMLMQHWSPAIRATMRMLIGVIMVPINNLC